MTHQHIGFSARIAIIGGGLGGLVAALQLQQLGVRDVVLFEARDLLGGRILSVDAAGAVVDPVLAAGAGSVAGAGSGADAEAAALDRFDLGPSWFWPELQPQLDRLVDELGLQRFAQFEAGDLLVERSAQQAPLRLRGMASEPASMRLAGGTGALIGALQRRLDASRLHTGQTVRRVQLTGSQVELQVQATATGTVATWRVDHVLLALPPRLAERRLSFDPPLPPALARRWRATPTWMAPHAKYVAIYDRPFWRELGLSGAARSSHGPMGEIHDVSMPGGHAALFGFLGLPAPVRRQLAPELLRAHCRAQLARLFGAPAATPVADVLKDWARDALTATGTGSDTGMDTGTSTDDDDAESDQLASGQHDAAAPPPGADDGPWRGRLMGVGSEWSPQFPGYLAGAVDAATRGVRLCLGASTVTTPPSAPG